MNRYMHTTQRFLISLLLVLVSPTVFGALIIVDEANDENNNDGDCSLREAILSANDNVSYDNCTGGDSSGFDLIWVLLGQTGQSISLSSPLSLTDAVDIQGPGMEELVLLPASGAVGSAFILDMGNAGEDVTIQDLRMGGFDDSAVQIVNADVVTFQDVRFSSNASSHGAAINAKRSDFGGATQSLTELIVRDSEFIQNSDVAINIWSASDLTVESSIFRGNRSDSGGVAITSGPTQGVMSISDSTFEDNQVNPGAPLDTSGGAIFSNYKTFSLSRSYFADNYAPRGGAVAILKPAGSTGVVLSTFTNSTFTGNNSDTNHSVIYVRGEQSLRLNYNTMSDNQIARLLLIGPTVDALLVGNIFDQTGQNDCTVEMGGTLTSVGYNLETDSSTCTGHASDLPNTPATILPAGDYGGATLTMPPHPASAAVDAGPIAPCNDAANNFTIGEDQRQEPRPRDGNASGGLGQCDAGAFEWPNAQTLLISFAGDGDGAVMLADYGLECLTPNACNWPLPEDATFTLTASPDMNNTFVEWGGACSGSGSCEVTMDSFTTISAEFDAPDNLQTLTINKNINDAGTDAVITSAPAGIDCGAACQADFIQSTVVTLTADPDTGSVIEQWDGCGSVSPDGLECTITMDTSDVVEVDIGADLDLIFADNFGD